MATQSAARRARLTQFATDLCLTNDPDELTIVKSTDEERKMKQIARETAIVIPAVAVLCFIALLIAQGRLFPDFLVRSHLARPVGDGCLYLSVPGLMVVLAVWGYSSARTIWSDLVFVSVNTIVYSTLIILFLWGLRRWRSAGGTDSGDHSKLG